MNNKQTLEVWMRGPVPGIPPLLQPVAHALLQAGEEIQEHLLAFPEDKLWVRPVGLASVAFHLQHITGVTDRLSTYARAEMLNEKQLQYLYDEGRETNGITLEALIEAFNKQVSTALIQLGHTDESQLTKPRGIGRRQLPTTLLGLLFHAAEHTQRHVGQLLVTAAVVKNLNF